MGGSQVLKIGAVALTAALFGACAFAGADTPAKAKKESIEVFGPEMAPVVTPAPIAPADTSTAVVAASKGRSKPEEIQKDYEKFVTDYRDLAGLFSADDFRTPGAKKFIEKIKFDKPDVQVKLAAFKKKLDLLQNKMRNLLQLQAVEVSENQFPRIYALAKQAAAKLELGPKFKIFILRSSSFNAFTYSYNTEDFDVVVHSNAIENLTDDTLLALFGHEMGHVKDQAMLNQLILAADFEDKNKDTAAATHMAFYDKVFDEFPASMRNILQKLALDLAANKSVVNAFENDQAAGEFSRNCELTADRAAVIVSGNDDAPSRLMAALAHGSKMLGSEFNIKEYKRQIREVLARTDSLEDIDALVQGQDTHPYAVLRLVQVEDYAGSEGFTTLRKRLEEPAYEKELDIFTRVYGRAAKLSKLFKKYLEDDAETDDTLARLKAQDIFATKMKRMGKGLSVVGLNLFQQLADSGLAAKEDKLFDIFLTKVKADKEDGLKNILLPPLSEVIKKLLENATGDEAVNLKARLTALEKLKEVE
jgi:hypothetical protein